MSDNENEQTRPADPRVPVDRSDITIPGDYYRHVIKGNCPIHGLTACECIHKSPDAKSDELDVLCIACKNALAEKGGI